METCAVCGGRLHACYVRVGRKGLLRAAPGKMCPKCWTYVGTPLEQKTAPAPPKMSAEERRKISAWKEARRTLRERRLWAFAQFKYAESTGRTLVVEDYGREPVQQKHLRVWLRLKRRYGPDIDLKRLRLY